MASSLVLALLIFGLLSPQDQWGVEPVRDQYVREAGKANFLDAEGKMCPATMATIFLGANEPDITGSCMGNMMVGAVFLCILKPCLRLCLVDVCR